MVETAPIQKTVTVKISEALADRIAERFKFAPLSELYDRLEPWVAKTYKSGLKKAMMGKFADVDRKATTGRTRTVRILRSQVRRLIIVAPVYGRTMGDMIEEKLWEILS